MGDEQGYNGWKNYETWSVALILDNDQGTYTKARQVVAHAIERGEASEYWTEDERRQYRTADALKDWIEERASVDITMSERRPLSYLWSQLLSAALSEVDWDEIARHYVEEYGEAQS